MQTASQTAEAAELITDGETRALIVDTRKPAGRALMRSILGEPKPYRDPNAWMETSEISREMAEFYRSEGKL